MKNDTSLLKRTVCCALNHRLPPKRTAHQAGWQRCWRIWSSATHTVSVSAEPTDPPTNLARFLQADKYHHSQAGSMRCFKRLLFGKSLLHFALIALGSFAQILQLPANLVSVVN